MTDRNKDRVNLYVNPYIKRRIENEWPIEGPSLSEFFATNAIEFLDAQKTVNDDGAHPSKDAEVA